MTRKPVMHVDDVMCSHALHVIQPKVTTKHSFKSVQFKRFRLQLCCIVDIIQNVFVQSRPAILMLEFIVLKKF